MQKYEENGKLRATRIRLATEKQVRMDLLAAKNESERAVSTLVHIVNSQKIALTAKQRIHGSNLRELSLVEKRIVKMEQEIASLISSEA